jgi:hypothetical protein
MPLKEPLGRHGGAYITSIEFDTITKEVDCL